MKNIDECPSYKIVNTVHEKSQTLIIINSNVFIPYCYTLMFVQRLLFYAANVNFYSSKWKTSFKENAELSKSKSKY
ncbi:hypothetical protein Smp_146920.2 [Schistosoma mansoni]|uniref:hypothetical protein n=1 Tax=Schistosoma mansoni TaxID=6183 RepID=UPI00022DC4AD|nr:hypothetical protein Smp_146920.2 [Schistosoma mansoni]|eukprot:XP_018650631.1 hypothetical protein Smp_146920.2 [Schistosoma mansoni]